MKKVLIILAMVAALVYIAGNLQVFGQAAPAAQFDHAQCQYPARLSNPPDGCDNSDPACGEIIKGAERCPADESPQVPVEPENPMSQNITETEFTEVVGK